MVGLPYYTYRQSASGFRNRDSLLLDGWMIGDLRVEIESSVLRRRGEVGRYWVVRSRRRRRGNREKEAEKVYKMRLRESNGAKYLGHAAAQQQQQYSDDDEQTCGENMAGCVYLCG